MRKTLFSLLGLCFSVALFSQNINVDLNDLVICEGEAAALNPVISGGDGNYTFTWSPATGLSCTDCLNPTASPSVTTAYTLSVEDGSGETVSDNVIISVIPITTTNLFEEICDGEVFLLNQDAYTAAGFYQATLTGSNGCDSIVNLELVVHPVITTNLTASTCGEDYVVGGQVFTQTGTYEIVLISAFGCDSIVNLDLTASPAVDFSFTVTDAFCNQPNGFIDLTVNSGTPPFTYEWSNGETVQTSTNLAPGDYCVTVTDTNGCTTIDCATVATSSDLMIEADITNADCGMNNGAIDITTTGGTAPYSYIWNTGMNVEDLTNILAGLYTVTITDANGCSAVENIQILNGPNNLNLTGSVLNISCNSGDNGAIDLQVNGGLAPFTYQWSEFGITTEDIENLSAGTYCVTVTDDGDCEVATCFVLDEPPALVINLQGSGEIACGNNEAFITISITGGTAPYAYNWSNGSTLPTLQVVTGGLYCVTVTDANGCEIIDCLTITEAPAMNVNINGPTEISCPNEEVTFSADVSGGTPGYVYQWSLDGVTIETSQEVTFNLPENALLSLIVTDANGCSISQSFFPNLTLFANISASPWDCNTASTTLDGSSSTQGANISYQWFGPAGNALANTMIVEVTQSGTYTLVVTNTDFSDCFATATVEVSNLEEIINDQDITQTLIACNTYELSYFTPINLPTLTSTWTFPNGTIESGASITSTETGIYTLTVDLGTGNCVVTKSIYVDTDASSCATINGYTRWDENEDCINDPVDPAFAGWIVVATNAITGESFVDLTNTEGYYEMSVPIGDYSVSVTPSSGGWEACIDVGNVTLANEGDEASFDFSFIRIVVCPELSVALSTSLLRRCFNSTYYLSVCNEGTETAVAPQATLILDDFLSYNGSAETPDQINGQEIHWTLGDLVPGECKTFWVSVYVSCDAALGQTHCTGLFATPDSLCLPGGQDWTGANLEVIGECVNDEAQFRVINTGTGDLLDAVSYVVIEDGVMMLEGAGVLTELPSEAEEVFNFPANGATYTFEINQAQGHPYTMSLTTSLEGCGVNGLGDFSTGFVDQFATQTSSPASDILCLENIGAYDPNDKAASPKGYGDQHYVVPETELNYRIRFQNTGTDTAFTVVVRDELSEWLDLTTFRMGTSSHDYTVDLDDQRTLTLTFDNILLPDSTTNLDASQGFFDFKIWPKSTIPLGTLVENSAAIFFDFNEPVITNTVFHTVDRNFIQVVNWTNVAEVSLDWKISPNPVQSTTTVKLTGDYPGDKILILTDLSGKNIQQFNLVNNQMELHLSDLPTGWYGMQLLSNDGKLLGTGKLVKQ